MEKGMKIEFERAGKWSRATVTRTEGEMVYLNIFAEKDLIGEWKYSGLYHETPVLKREIKEYKEIKDA